MTLEHSLATLKTSGLIHLAQLEPELKYLFRHALVQEATYESMLREDRKRLHLTIGETMERHFPERLDEFAPLLSHHFLQSENYQKALKYSQLAAEKAIQQYANQEAVMHLKNGIAVVENLPEAVTRDRVEVILLTMLGSAYIVTRGEGSDLVFETFRRALEICENKQMYARAFPVQIGLIAYYFARARVADARDTAEKVFAFSQNHSAPFIDSWANWALGSCLFFSGEFDSAKALLARAARAPQLPHLISAVYDGRVNSYGINAQALGLLGYFDQSLNALQKGLALAEDINQPFTLANIYMNSAFTYLMHSDLENTRQCAETLINLSEEYGFKYIQAIGKIFQGWVLGREGTIERGLKELQEGLKNIQDMKTLMFRSFYLLQLADIYLQVGKVGEGLNVIDQTLQFIEHSGERFYEAEVFRMKGELLLAQDNEESEDWFRKAIEVAQRQQARSLELRATMRLCKLLEKQGNRQEARQQLTAIYNWFTEGLDTPDLQQARRLLASLA